MLVPSLRIDRPFATLHPGQSHLEFQSQWSHPSCAIGMERPWISGATKTFGTIEITRLVHPDGVSGGLVIKNQLHLGRRAVVPVNSVFKCDCPVFGRDSSSQTI